MPRDSASSKKGVIPVEAVRSLGALVIKRQNSSKACKIFVFPEALAPYTSPSFRRRTPGRTSRVYSSRSSFSAVGIKLRVVRSLNDLTFSTEKLAIISSIL